MNIEITKRDFWRYINKKIKKIVHHQHVLNIISILFEEMILDLKNDKEIKIFNLGTLFLQKNNSKKYYDVRFQKIMESKPAKILKFVPSKKFKKKLVSRIDLDKK